MRTANNKNLFTPFSLWLQEYVRQDLSITNLDFVIEDYKNKKIMLLEEKQCNGKMNKAQLLTFEVLDYALFKMSEKHNYEYWGFYELKFPKNATMPGPGMTLNGSLITTEQLAMHLSFEERFCEGHQFSWWCNREKFKKPEAGTPGLKLVAPYQGNNQPSHATA